MINTTNGVGDTISGGANNTTNGTKSGTIGGGYYNSVSGMRSTVGGGYTNTAGADYATVAGGDTNTASASYATIGGGSQNTASGTYATVPGGYKNAASGRNSFAAGCYANANYEGAFVWAGEDATNTCYYPNLSGAGQFAAAAPGGVWFYSGSGTGVTLPAGSGTWSSISDRNMKENFKSVDGSDLLTRLNGIPMSTWNYKPQDPRFRHLGPMAQDFYAAFGLGEDDKHIDDIDGQGVALAGLQALYRLNLKKDAEIQRLAGEVQKLRARENDLSRQVRELEKVQQQMATLEARLGQVEARTPKPRPKTANHTALAKPAPRSLTLAKVQF
jgi:hypothetical protein